MGNVIAHVHPDGTVTFRRRPLTAEEAEKHREAQFAQFARWEEVRIVKMRLEAAQMELEAARLRSSAGQSPEQSTPSASTGPTIPADAHSRELVTTEVYFPTYPKVFDRWHEIWTLIKPGYEKGRTITELYEDLGKKNKPLARFGGKDTLPKIIAAGKLGKLDRKVERI